MNRMKHTTQIILAAMTVLQSSPACAEEAAGWGWADSAWYLGAGVGRSRASLDDEAIARIWTTAGSGPVTMNSERGADAYKLFIGKQLSRNFAIEGGWFDLGKFGFNAGSSSLGTFSGNDTVRGLNMDMLLQMPLSQSAAIYGRLGTNYARAETNMNGLPPGLATRQSREGFNVKFGFGLEYRFNAALAMRLDAERYRVHDPLRNRRDVDFYSLNLIYRFGEPEARAMPAPMPISDTRPAPAQAVAPLAPVQAAPVEKPKPVSEKVTFSAMTLFDFDQSVIKPEGRQALDDLLRQLQDMDTEVMVTVGHTDSVGTDAYNQKLSLRRAEAIKAYLMSKGVAQERVFTEGKGESQPVADNNTAENRAKNRRVTVEVVGTRNVVR